MPCALRNTMEPQQKHWTNPFPLDDNITKNEHSALFFLSFILAVFRKGYLEIPKGHMETKLYYGSYDKYWNAVFCLRKYTRLFILKIGVCTSPRLSPPFFPCTSPSPCHIEKIMKNKYNNHILYTNIFIERSLWWKFSFCVVYFMNTHHWTHLEKIWFSGLLVYTEYIHPFSSPWLCPIPRELRVVFLQEIVGGAITRRDASKRVQTTTHHHLQVGKHTYLDII